MALAVAKVALDTLGAVKLGPTKASTRGENRRTVSESGTGIARTRSSQGSPG
jgi:hypothetical protein